MKDAAELKANAQARLDEYEEKLASIEKKWNGSGATCAKPESSSAHASLPTPERVASAWSATPSSWSSKSSLAARESLTREMVEAAMRSATETLKARVTPADHARFADEYLARLRSVKGVSRAAGSSA